MLLAGDGSLIYIILHHSDFGIVEKSERNILVPKFAALCTPKLASFTLFFFGVDTIHSVPN